MHFIPSIGSYSDLHRPESYSNCSDYFALLPEDRAETHKQATSPEVFRGYAWNSVDLCFGVVTVEPCALR